MATPMGIPIHKRMFRVQSAKAEIGTKIFELANQHQLTSNEMLWILSEHMAMLCKWKVQKERHPNDPDKAVDEA
jgi:hypothetical protein